jgi:putative membrane protein
VIQVAQKAGVMLKEKPGIMDDMKMKSLNNKKGTEFDQAFAQAMVADHKKDIAKLQDAQKDGDLSPDVKNLVSQLLPTLQKHLETAQKLAGSSKTS